MLLEYSLGEVQFFTQESGRTV